MAGIGGVQRELQPEDGDSNTKITKWNRDSVVLRLSIDFASEVGGTHIERQDADSRKQLI